MNKPEKQAKTHRHRQQQGVFQREEAGEVLKDKGGQKYGDGRRFDFRRCTFNAM